MMRVLHPLLFCLLCTQTCWGFVIAPPWVNLAHNPCSESSWQLLYWPADKRCYKIFSQGPCPESQELSYQQALELPVCQCPQSLPLHWNPTDRCYARYSRGPCDVNQYLDVHSVTEQPVCRVSERCEPGRIFWPPDGECHQLYTQGPCHKGDLLIVNPLTTEPYCGCDSNLLHQYYYPPLNLCYEQMTRGPCEAGLLFMYNHTTDSTQCACTDNVPNYSSSLGQCYELGSKGPCHNGQVFVHKAEQKTSMCECKDGYVYWPSTDSCFREYTPGPCNETQFIVGAGQNGQGTCQTNPCPKTDLFFPSSSNGGQGECHKVGNRGPCPMGELVIFEAYSGKSYRGSCGCSPGYNQNYWSADGRCYEWYSQGPCNKSYLFKYNRETRSTECVCDVAAGMVYWAETEGCYPVYTQGPCPDHSWLVGGEGEDEVYCECRDGYFFNAEEYSCDPLAPVVQISGHRFHTLWNNVAEYVKRKESEGLSRKSENTAGADRRAEKTRKLTSGRRSTEGRQPAVRRLRDVKRRRRA